MDYLTPRTMKITGWLVLAVLTVAGWLAFGRQVAGGIVVGGLVALVNFHLMAHILTSVLGRTWKSQEEWQTAGRQAVSFMTARYILRFLALMVIIFLLIRSGWVHIFGLIIGLSTIVITLLILGLMESRKIFFSKVSEELS
jgi:hypothetical protein